MENQIRRIVFVFSICIFGLAQIQARVAQTKHPTLYVDKGICPGEGCSIESEDRAKVIKSTTVYVNPNSRSAPRFNLSVGEVVSSLKSEVHTVAGRFVVKRDYEKYRAGEVLWVYTYLGEGNFKVWNRGKMYQEDLGFSPWGGGVGKRCELDNAFCWGELEKELEMIWWLKIKSKDGRKGWIRVDENLDWYGK
jgi:hypothetical protein